MAQSPTAFWFSTAFLKAPLQLVDRKVYMHQGPSQVSRVVSRGKFNAESI